MTDTPRTPDRLSPVQEALLIFALGGLLVLTAALLAREVLLFA